MNQQIATKLMRASKLQCQFCFSVPCSVSISRQFTNPDCVVPGAVVLILKELKEHGYGLIDSGIFLSVSTLNLRHEYKSIQMNFELHRQAL